MVSIANNSNAQLNNVTVTANIPMEITSLGNLQVDETAVSGDIVSGVNVGNIAPATAKIITFEGKTAGISMQSTKQATATVSASGNSRSDSVSIVLNPGQASAAAVSAASGSSGLWEFIKRWYLWILVALVLIFLFIVVFRRLSSNA